MSAFRSRLEPTSIPSAGREDSFPWVLVGGTAIFLLLWLVVVTKVLLHLGVCGACS